MSQSANEICSNFTRDVVPTLYTTPTYGYRVGSLIYGIFIHLYFIAGFIFFVVNKKKYVSLKPRSTFLAFLAMISGLLAPFGNITSEFIGRELIPCQARIRLFHITLFFIAPGMTGTLFLYIYKLRRERIELYRLIKSSKPAKKGHERNISNNLSGVKITYVNDDDKSTLTSVESACQMLSDFFNVLKYSTNGRIIVPSSDAASGNNNNNNNKIESVNDNDSQPGTETESVDSGIHSLFKLNESAHANYKKTFRQRVVHGILFPTALVILLGIHIPIAIQIRIILDPVPRAGCNGCVLTYVDYIINFVNVATYLIACGLAMYATRNEPDPLNLFKDAKLIQIFANLPLASWILMLTDPGNLYKQYIFNWFWIDGLGLILLYSVLVILPVLRAIYSRGKSNRRPGQMMRQQSVTSNDSAISVVQFENGEALGGGSSEPPPPSSLDVYRILNEPKSRNALLEHAVDELSSENLVFLFKLKTWKSLYEREPAEKVARTAANLFKEYISRDSKTPINIPNSVYIGVERQILPYLSQSDGDISTNSTAGSLTSAKVLKPPANIFDACENECMLIIETDTLPRFVKSEIFKTRIMDAGLLKKISKR